MIGPEMRQYWFLNYKEGKPVDRDTAEAIAKAGKYANTVVGFGSKKDFSLTSFYLSNSMFPLNTNELSVDNDELIKTYTYRSEERRVGKELRWRWKEDSYRDK